jgi:hypothetical protein
VGGETTTIGRIWCDAGFPLELTPSPGAAGLTFTVLDPSRNPLRLNNGKAQTTARGWHTLQVTSATQGATPFDLAVTWTSTQNL